MDLFFNHKKTSKEEQKTDDSNEFLKEYDDLKDELEKLQNQNRGWEKEFNKIISAREKAQQLERENNLLEALEVYLESIRSNENSDKMTIYNYAFDIDRVIILYGKTKQKEKLKIFLEEKIRRHNNYNRVNEWIVRLSKLNSKNEVKIIPIRKEEVLPQFSQNPTLGKKIDEFKKQFPEFNFYYDMPDQADTFSYPNKVPFELTKRFGKLRHAFEIIKSRARVAENERDFKTAIEAYEKMVIEECEDVEPYERLIIIYSKLKWKEEEMSILKRGISFFGNLKVKQLNYVNQLATKYGMSDKANEFISQGKKIYYYLGAFELYNPQTTRLKKWHNRLEKLEKK